MVQIDAGHFSRDASVELSETLAKPVSYKLMYFPMLSNGATGRDLLAYGGVEWSSVAPAVSFSSSQECNVGKKDQHLFPPPFVVLFCR